MLTLLLESRARSPRRRVAMVSSIIGHSAMLLMLALTHAAGSPGAASKPVAANVVYFPPTPPQHHTQQPPVQTATSSFATRNIPTIDLPSIPVPTVVAGIREFLPTLPNYATQGSLPVATVKPSAGDSSSVLSALSVDQPVEVIAGQRPPRYPLVLERAGIAGDVVAQFVVDTTGRVERGTIAILHASHDEFADAVRERLLALRFVAARAQGRVVRQLVQQRFAFEVVRR